MALIAKIAPEAGWNYSWGHEAFNEKRYWDALLYLENLPLLLFPAPQACIRPYGHAPAG